MVLTPEGRLRVEQAQATNEPQQRTRGSGNPKKVFVIHGRDEPRRNAMFAFLRSIQLEPIEWSQARKMTGKASPYVGEILQAAFAQAQAVVALLTGDDEARLRDDFCDSPAPEPLTPQARPNVLFEAGMAMGSHPDRTVFVEVGALRPFSDIAGIHTVRITDKSPGVAERQELANRLLDAGCDVNLDGTDWHTAGDFW